MKKRNGLSLFQFTSAYSLSQNAIKITEISRLLSKKKLELLAGLSISWTNHYQANKWIWTLGLPYVV